MPGDLGIRASSFLRHYGLGISHSRSGFSIMELLVAMTILILIVAALMAVFNGTQRAFRSVVTQTDILENGRATMELMASDLSGITPSDYPSNGVGNLASEFESPVRVPVLDYPYYGNVNFYISPARTFVTPESPLIQPLIGSSPPVNRTNLLEDIFFLSKANVAGASTWIGTGYAVNTNLNENGVAVNVLYPLYRFYMTAPTMAGTPAELFSNFLAYQFTDSAVWSHLMDGVVGLTARAYDPNGFWMTNYVDYEWGTIPNTDSVTNYNTWFFPPAQSANDGEACMMMFSNAVPAMVQIEMDTLEDRTLQRAESLSGSAQNNYLTTNAVGKIHVFRQRVEIQNADLAAY